MVDHTDDQALVQAYFVPHKESSLYSEEVPTGNRSHLAVDYSAQMFLTIQRMLPNVVECRDGTLASAWRDDRAPVCFAHANGGRILKAMTGRDWLSALSSCTGHTLKTSEPGRLAAAARRCQHS